jgi:hypothetical protein
VDVNQITTEILNNFKSEDWKQKFASINNLRIINKYYPNDSNQIFQLFWEQILVSLDTKLTYIERTILNLFREAFAFKRENNFHDKILCDVIPKLLAKSVHHHKKFCKDLATETLGYIVNNYVNDAVIENVSGLVVKCSKEKDFLASDEALKYLSMIIQNLGPQLSQVSSRSLQCIFFVISECLLGLRRSAHGVGQRIAAHICNLMTYNNYMNYLQQLYTQELITEKAVIQMKNCLEYKEKSGPGRVSQSVATFKKSVTKGECLSVKLKQFDQGVLAKEPQMQTNHGFIGMNNNQNNTFGQQHNNNFQNCPQNNFQNQQQNNMGMNMQNMGQQPNNGFGNFNNGNMPMNPSNQGGFNGFNGNNGY